MRPCRNTPTETPPGSPASSGPYNSCVKVPKLDLARLATRLPRPWRTRYAPSPTGHLHLGHVVNAIYTWGVAAALDGEVLVRLEDHDRSRCRAEYESSILDDLAWLGLLDRQSRSGGATAVRQSDDEMPYREGVERLRRASHVFACDCTRRDIARAARPVANEEPPYPGRCTHRGLPESDGHALRVVLPPGKIAFEDALCGGREMAPAAQVGALMLRDRHGHWTYQFAVSVDDVRHGIALVVRGVDLLPSTGRQVLVMRMLGRDTPPTYLHHPLIHRPDGLKLSKANRDAGVRELREDGLTPADVFGLAAHAVGLLEVPRPVTPAEFPRLIAA